ncbi:MAG TPA: hypothetical protein VNZ67_13905, partial [bacterium]|nr:hypothetical protein [bacterium]
EFFGHDDFYPYPVPHPTGHLPPARPISPAVSGAHAAGPDKDLQFQVIYGQGYRLNPALLNALLQTGWRLQEAGAEVFFVVSPATMDELQRRWGPEIRGQVDAGDQALVRQLGDRGLRALDLHAEDQRAFYESPAEHLDGAGRRAVAERLLRWMADALDQAGAGARR